MANQAQILLFHINNDRQRSLERLCRSLSVSIKINVIKPSSYLQSLGYLAGISGFAKSSANYIGNDFESEMLVFSGVASELMDEFIDGMKKLGLPPIGLKAIITPTNIFWTPKQLYDELSRERLAWQNHLVQ